MPSAIRTPKNLPEWVELDYYQRERGLRRWRGLLTRLALLLSLLAVVTIKMLPGAQRMAQPGPVSHSHSLFSDDCARCHQEPFLRAAKFADWEGKLAVVPDLACRNCHDGPAHNLVVNEHTACATCHREHRGRDELARVPDGYCVKCHADLPAHRDRGADGLLFATVRSFTGDHPEFALHRNSTADPARVHFNHKAHLKGGGVRRPNG